MAVMIDPPRWPAHGRLSVAPGHRRIPARAARAGCPRRHPAPGVRGRPLRRPGRAVRRPGARRRRPGRGARAAATSGRGRAAGAEAARRARAVEHDRDDHLPDAGPGRLDVVRSSLSLSSDAAHEHLLLDRDADGEALLVRGQAGTGRCRRCRRPPDPSTARIGAAPARRRARARYRTRGPGPRARSPGPAGSGVQRAMRVPTDDAARLLGDDPVALLLGQDRGVH